MSLATRRSANASVSLAQVTDARLRFVRSGDDIKPSLNFIPLRADADHIRQVSLVEKLLHPFLRSLQRVCVRFVAIRCRVVASELFRVNRTPHRNPVSPPELAADAPVAEAGVPVVEGLGVAVGDEAELAVVQRRQGEAGEAVLRHSRPLDGAGVGHPRDRLLHGDVPLVAQVRLDGDVAAVAVADAVAVGFDFLQQFVVLEPLDDALAGVLAGLADEAAGGVGLGGPAVGVGDAGVGGHHVDDGQVVPLADVPVVGVVGGRDL